jgi:hypothetical protein
LLLKKDAGVRGEAAWAIGLGGPDAVLQVVEKLKILLKDYNADVREVVAGAVGDGGPKAVKQAVGELKAALSDGDASVRAMAAWAIRRGGSEVVLKAMDELKTLLGDANPVVRARAAEAIGEGGSKAVGQNREGLLPLLDDKDASVRESAALSLKHGDSNVIKDVAAHLRPSLDLLTDSEVRRNATELVDRLGLAVIEHLNPELQGLIRDSDFTSYFGDEVRNRQKIVAASARALRQYYISSQGIEAISTSGDTYKWSHDLYRARRNLKAKAQVLPDVADPGATRDVKYAIYALLWAIEDACIIVFRNQTGFGFPVRGRTVEVPAGYMVKADTDAAQFGINLQAHKCPNARACLGEALSVEVPGGRASTQPRANDTCRFAPVNESRTPNCSAGYNSSVAGCAGCLQGWGRSPSDAFTCQECPGQSNRESGQWALTWALWLARPSALLAISLRSALMAAARGPAAAFTNDVLKIALSFSSSAAIILSSLDTSTAHRDLSVDVKNWLEGFSMTAGSGEPIGYSSYDCLFWHALSLDELLAVSLLNPAIVLVAAAMLLGIISFVRRRQSLESNFVEDMMTLVLVMGNLYLPNIAAACAIAVPCYHTQTEEYRMTDKAAGKFLMAYSITDSCGNRLSYLAVRVPVLALAVVAGPILWAWLLHRDEKQDLKVVIDKSSGQALGIEWDPQTLRIKAVDTDGLVHQWNETHPELAIKRNDRIVRANGIRNDVQGIMNECNQNKKLELAIDRGQFLRFLTASYKHEDKWWESNRLAKNILLKCAVAVAPISYFPGLQLSLVLCLMFSFTAWHLRNYPYKFELLNIVEAVSLCVLNVSMMTSSLLVSGTWPLTKPFARYLIIASYGLVAINALGLASLFLWAKFWLDDDHELFKKVRDASS